MAAMAQKNAERGHPYAPQDRGHDPLMMDKRCSQICRCSEQLALLPDARQTGQKEGTGPNGGFEYFYWPGPGDQRYGNTIVSLGGNSSSPPLGADQGKKPINQAGKRALGVAHPYWKLHRLSRVTHPPVARATQPCT